MSKGAYDDGLTREALSVSGLPVGPNGEDYFYARVGQDWKVFDQATGRYVTAGKVTRITVRPDLPGLHADMERVRVFVGDQLAWEGPLHGLEGVAYPVAPA